MKELIAIALVVIPFGLFSWGLYVWYTSLMVAFDLEEES